MIMATSKEVSGAGQKWEQRKSFSASVAVKVRYIKP